jgi:hypothetical protein
MQSMVEGDAPKFDQRRNEGWRGAERVPLSAPSDALRAPPPPHTGEEPVEPDAALTASGG